MNHLLFNKEYRKCDISKTGWQTATLKMLCYYYGNWDEYTNTTNLVSGQ